MVAKAEQDEFPRTKRVATGMTCTHVESERKGREREREMERHESSGWHDFSVFLLPMITLQRCHYFKPFFYAQNTAFVVSFFSLL